MEDTRRCFLYGMVKEAESNINLKLEINCQWHKFSQLGTLLLSTMAISLCGYVTIIFIINYDRGKADKCSSF